MYLELIPFFTCSTDQATTAFLVPCATTKLSSLATAHPGRNIICKATGKSYKESKQHCRSRQRVQFDQPSYPTCQLKKILQKSKRPESRRCTFQPCVTFIMLMTHLEIKGCLDDSSTHYDIAVRSKKRLLHKKNASFPPGVSAC